MLTATSHRSYVGSFPALLPTPLQMFVKMPMLAWKLSEVTRVRP